MFFFEIIRSFNSTHAKIGRCQWDRTQLKPRIYLNIIAGRFSFCLCLCFTDLTHFSQIEKFNEQFFAVCQTNWRGEELFVICQAASAGCQYHNRGMWLFYLWIQFNYNSLILYIVQFNSCKIGLISVRSNTIETKNFFEHCSWAL